MHLPGRKAGPGYRAQHREAPAVPGNGRCPLPVLSLCTGTASPGPLRGAVPSLGKELDGKSAPARGQHSLPSWFPAGQGGGGCSSLVLSRLDAGLCSYAWNVPEIYQSLSVQRFLLGRGGKSLCCLPASSFPWFCRSSAFPQPSITCFFPYHPTGDKRRSFCGCGGKWDARLKPR